VEQGRIKKRYMLLPEKSQKELKKSSWAAELTTSLWCHSKPLGTSISHWAIAPPGARAICVFPPLTLSLSSDSPLPQTLSKLLSKDQFSHIERTQSKHKNVDT